MEEKPSRRSFIKMAALGAGAVLAATVAGSQAALSGVSLLGEAAPTRQTKINVRAVGGLPESGFPSYATFVVEGILDLKAQTGTLTKTVFAGPPEAATTVALPRLSRVIRVTGIREDGDKIIASGRLDDVSQLRVGEPPEVQVELNRSSGTLNTEFLDSRTSLSLV